jgi:hypothetical protein
MSLLPQVERELLEAALRTSPAYQRPPRRPRRVLIGVVAALAVAVVVVLGVGAVRHDGAVSADAATIVADAYRAATPADDILHIVSVSQSSAVRHGRLEHSPRFREQTWLIAHPFADHDIATGDGTVSEIAFSRGTYDQWDNDSPRVIHRSAVSASTQRFDPSAMLRALYRSGRVVVAGRLRIDDVAVWRLKVSKVMVHDTPPPASTVFVDARTFAPIEQIDYRATQRHRGGPWTVVGRFITRYPVFEHLPATPANRALLRMRPHPGARIVTVP